MRVPTGLLAVLLVMAAPAHAGIYKWIDSQGGVHYSQEPPSDAAAKEMAPAPAPADNTDAAGSASKSSSDATQKQPGAQNKAAQQQKSNAKRKAEMAENCRRAHANLRVLTAGGRKRYRLPDGTVRYLPESQVQARIKEAQGQIKSFCGPDQGS